MEKSKLDIKEAIVVEGRDDSNIVRQITDGLIIETHGFGIARETWELLDRAYEEKGLVILTDPDFAGEKIRARLKEKYPEAKHAYMPREKATKEGDIGIENAEPQMVLEVLKKLCTISKEVKYEFSSKDMDEAGLSGYADSKKMREKVGEILGIGYANSGAFIKKLKGFGITKEEFLEAVKKARDESI